jgi:hypothetical protein
MASGFDTQTGNWEACRRDRASNLAPSSAICSFQPLWIMARLHPPFSRLLTNSRQPTGEFCRQGCELITHYSITSSSKGSLAEARRLLRRDVNRGYTYIFCNGHGTESRSFPDSGLIPIRTQTDERLSAVQLLSGSPVLQCRFHRQLPQWSAC